MYENYILAHSAAKKKIWAERRRRQKVKRLETFCGIVLLVLCWTLFRVFLVDPLIMLPIWFIGIFTVLEGLFNENPDF